MVLIRKRCSEAVSKQHAKTTAAARKKAMRTEGPCAKALRRKIAAKLASKPADTRSSDAPGLQDGRDFPLSLRPASPDSVSPTEVADSAIVLEDDDNDACETESCNVENRGIARSIGRNLFVPSNVQVDTLLNILCAFQDTEETEEALNCVLRLAAESRKPGDEFGVQFLRNCISQLNELSIDHARLEKIIDMIQQNLERVCDRAVCQVRSLGKLPLNDYKMIEDVPSVVQSESTVQPVTDTTIDQVPSTIDTILDATMEDLVEATEQAEQADQADEEDPRVAPIMIEAELDAAIADLVSVVVEEEQEVPKATTITTEAELDFPSSGPVDVAEEEEYEDARATQIMIEAELDVPMPGVVGVTEEVEQKDAKVELARCEAKTKPTMAEAVNVQEKAEGVDDSVPPAKKKRSKSKSKRSRRAKSLPAAVQDQLNENRKALRPWKPNDGTASFYVARAPMKMPLDLFVRSAADAHYFASDESPVTIAAYTREVRRVWTRLQPEQRAAWITLFNSRPTTESLSVRGQKLLKLHGLLVKSLSDACLPA